MPSLDLDAHPEHPPPIQSLPFAHLLLEGRQQHPSETIPSPTSPALLGVLEGKERLSNLSVSLGP